MRWLGLPVRRPKLKSRQAPMDFSICFSASPNDSEPTLNCSSTVSLAKKVAKSTKNLAKLPNQLKQLCVKSLRNRLKLFGPSGKKVAKFNRNYAKIIKVVVFFQRYADLRWSVIGPFTLPVRNGGCWRFLKNSWIR